MLRLHLARRCKMIGLGFISVVLTLYLILGVQRAQVVPKKVQPINLSVYYETLCPDSKRFILDQLWPTYQAVPNIINVDLISYGKAHEKKLKNGTYVFDCQHGPDECYGNLVQTCAINIFDISKALPLVQCMESYQYPQKEGEKCARRQDLDYRLIAQCVKSPQGNVWQHEMAEKTNSLNPRLHFVPWITVNGAYVAKYHEAALHDLLGLVCKLYNGPKPEACPGKT